MARFHSQYNELESGIAGETWSQYWTRLSKDKVWVDFWFVQATAWYLQLDLWIVDCESRDDHPFIQVSGNLDNPEVSCGGPIITLGTKSSCHYQSLLPTEIFHLEFDKILISDILSNRTTKELTKYSPSIKHEDNPCKPKVVEANTISCQTNYERINKMTMKNSSRKAIIKEEIKGRVTRSIAQLNNDKNETINRKPIPLVIETKEYQPFMYEDNGKVLIFQQLSHDYIMRCPNCKMETKQIIQHLVKSNDCRIIADISTFKSRFQTYKASQNKEVLLLKQRNRQKHCDDKQKATNIEQFKENQRNRQKRCDDEQGGD